METNKNIENKVNQTIHAINNIEHVNVSPFFKEQTMQRLFKEKEDVVGGWSWFTPKVQLATLICVVVLNVFAFVQLQKTSYNNDINAFAETYGLSANTDTSVLN